jgi:phosphoribosylformylglycinamidine synthase subunit PurL
VVAESALNVACVGGRPVALVNCLNFGNPEHPEIMWQFSETIDGMAEACVALGIPVVGGNVSFYNESQGTDIDPTPVVGTLGLVDELRPGTPRPALGDGNTVLLLGPSGPGATSLAGSRWAAQCRAGDGTGAVLADLDLQLHKRLLALVAELVNARLVEGIHDVSDGGIGVALAEMAVKSATGCRVNGIADYEELFGEGPSRVLTSVPPGRVERVAAIAGEARIPIKEIGIAGGDRLVVEGLVDVSVAEAEAAWKGALPAIFSALSPADEAGT